MHKTVEPLSRRSERRRPSDDGFLSSLVSMPSLTSIWPWFLISVPLPPAVSRPKNSRTITVHPSFLDPYCRQRNPASSPAQRKRVRLHATSARNAYIDLPSACSCPPPQHHHHHQQQQQQQQQQRTTTTTADIDHSDNLQAHLNPYASTTLNTSTLPHSTSYNPIILL
ncbi:uncharacterized protein B0T23DRAFT_200178 [Neurospora hispaniola]|uniref:Uncharacterized protein n=1 Tax=Neurospora hispaniola TaxID=588809 RepID=A0AAJ0I4G8_9PEZI|nr:hypothetical protein B0T23DRAFT_200178 [Neurospora hispaniola]